MCIIRSCGRFYRHCKHNRSNSHGAFCGHFHDGIFRFFTFFTKLLIQVHILQCKLIRMQRPSLIEHASEYVCCYRAALQFLDTSYDPDQRQQQTPQTDTSREFAALGGDVATLFPAPISPVELVGRGGVPVQAQQRSYGSSRSPPQSQLYLG